METLQKAFDVLESQIGEFDNVKLLLCAGFENMSPETVAEEILVIAEGIRTKEFVAQSGFKESALVGVQIAR